MKICIFLSRWKVREMWMAQFVIERNPEITSTRQLITKNVIFPARVLSIELGVQSRQFWGIVVRWHVTLRSRVGLFLAIVFPGGCHLRRRVSSRTPVCIGTSTFLHGGRPRRLQCSSTGQAAPINHRLTCARTNNKQKNSFSGKNIRFCHLLRPSSWFYAWKWLYFRHELFCSK